MAEYSKYSKLPGDSILALLEPGEYVLNRNAVDEIGKENLDELNFEDAPRYNMAQRMEMQIGGMLGDMHSMQTGGTITHGQSETKLPTFDSLYEEMKMAPKPGEERKIFEDDFQYDPSREQIAFDDYSKTMSDAARTGANRLQSQLMSQQGKAAKSGFAGAGGGAGQAMSRDTILGDFMSQQASAQSSLFKGVQSERDAWMREAGQGLSQLHSQEGTIDYDSYIEPKQKADDYAAAQAAEMSGAPTNPQPGETWISSTGNEYVWTGTEWDLDIPERNDPYG